MNTSGSRSGGYERKKNRRLPAAQADKQQRTKTANAKEAKGREALDMMFAAFHALLEAQRRAYAGEKNLDEHAADMRKLLRYVQRRMKETMRDVGTTRQPRRRKATRS
jgi:hypothetical protein